VTLSRKDRKKSADEQLKLHAFRFLETGEMSFVYFPLWQRGGSLLRTARYL